MYSKSYIFCALGAVCALTAACRPVVKLSTDGSLTEYAVITISPAKAQPLRLSSSRAFAAREGCKGEVSFRVPRDQARAPFIATLVPDYHREGNEISRRFVPAETKSILFSQEGITLTPKRGK